MSEENKDVERLERVRIPGEKAKTKAAVEVHIPDYVMHDFGLLGEPLRGKVARGGRRKIRSR